MQTGIQPLKYSIVVGIEWRKTGKMRRFCLIWQRLLYRGYGSLTRYGAVSWHHMVWSCISGC